MRVTGFDSLSKHSNNPPLRKGVSLSNFKMASGFLKYDRYRKKP